MFELGSDLGFGEARWPLQPEAVPRIHSHSPASFMGYAAASQPYDPGVEIFRLSDIFRFESADVFTYLASHSHLLPILNEARSVLPVLAPGAVRYSLDIFRDPIESRGGLMLKIAFSGSADEALAALERLHDGWWRSALERTSDMEIAVDFV